MRKRIDRNGRIPSTAQLRQRQLARLMYVTLGAEANLGAMLERNADAPSREEFRTVNKARNALITASIELERALGKGEMTKPIVSLTLADMTPWFAAGVRPARPGVYQVKIPCPGRFDTTDCWICVYSYWTGICWGQYQHSAKAAANVIARGDASKFQSYEWRGLRGEFQ